MKVYGLTGGIASGKSTVARMLRTLGAEVVDADELARVVVQPGTAGGVPFAFYEAALLVDNGAHRALDGLVVVETSPEVQRARLVERDGLSTADADRRLAAQLPNGARREAADVVIPNDGAEQDLAQRVQALYDRLQNGGPLRPPERGAAPPSKGV
jgi:dephospho-CoA kinase